LFAVGATLFEWSTRNPYIYSTVKSRNDLAFYLDVHEFGRLLEDQETNGDITLLKNRNGGYSREQLNPDRNQKSILAPVLDIICSKAPKQRTSAEEILQSKELKSCLECIQKQAEIGNLYIIYFSFCNFPLKPFR
jgi:hypothetical protein